MSHPVAEERPAVHGDALNLVRAAIAEAAGPDAAAQRVVDLLHDRFPAYDWVGVYWVDGGDLVLGPWTGPEATEHTRIPIGTGICGAAAASGETEIVVPIFDGGGVIGEIDIDGSDAHAFDATDARFLEEIAALLAPLRPRT